MSSISSAYSPLQQLQAQLQSSVSTGSIKSADQTALSNALTSIDDSLTGSSSTDTSQAKPGDLKSKVDDLIASQVSSGALTSDQATELQSVFDKTFGGDAGSADTASADAAGGTGGAEGAHHGHGGPRGPGGPGGPGGAGGPPPADGADSTDGTSTTTSADDILQQFLKTLQAAQTESSTSYSAGGSTSSTTASNPLLIDYTS